MPNSDFGFGSAVVDNKIYVICSNGTQIYDPESDSWSLGAQFPINVDFPGVCSTTGVMSPKRIFLFGGTIELSRYSNVTQVYDPESDTWTLGAPMPSPRGGVTTAVVNDRIYVLGGMAITWGGSGLTANEQYTPFGYGTILPIVSIITPTNKLTYDSTEVPLVFTVNRPIQNMNYSLDGQPNVTKAGNITLTGLINGQHNVTIYAEDTLGNIGASETIIFSITKTDFFSIMLIAIIIVAVVIGIGLIIVFNRRK